MKQTGLGIQEALGILEKNPEGDVKVKFSLEAGLLNRGAIRRELDRAKHQMDGEFIYTESKGILESEFFMSFDGPACEILAVVRWVERNLTE